MEVSFYKILQVTTNFSHILLSCDSFLHVCTYDVYLHSLVVCLCMCMHVEGQCFVSSSIACDLFLSLSQSLAVLELTTSARLADWCALESAFSVLSLSFPLLGIKLQMCPHALHSRWLLRTKLRSLYLNIISSSSTLVCNNSSFVSFLISCLCFQKTAYHHIGQFDFELTFLLPWLPKC